MSILISIAIVAVAFYAVWAVSMKKALYRPDQKLSDDKIIVE